VVISSFTSAYSINIFLASLVCPEKVNLFAIAVAIFFTPLSCITGKIAFDQGATMREYLDYWAMTVAAAIAIVSGYLHLFSKIPYMGVVFISAVILTILTLCDQIRLQKKQDREGC
jgi:hypothetical protein